MLISAGVKTNIHYVLHNESIKEALHRMKSRTFPKGINAVIFLLHKPVGLGTEEKVISIDNEDYIQFIKYISEEKLECKVGFDSCIVPALINHQRNPKMIEIATEKRWKEDFKSKHGTKAGRGWFRYNTRFALPVMNEHGDILDYNVYQVVLLVRYSISGKLYLYDIQNIKKKRDTHFGQNSQTVRNPLLCLIIIHYMDKHHFTTL